MRHVDTTRTNEKRLPPRVSKGWDIRRVCHNGGLEAIQWPQMHSRNHQNLVRIRIRAHSSLNLFSKLPDISDNTKHNFGMGFVRYHVWRAAGNDGSYVQRTWAKKFVNWQLDPPHAF